MSPASGVSIGRRENVDSARTYGTWPIVQLWPGNELGMSKQKVSIYLQYFLAFHSMPTTSPKRRRLYKPWCIKPFTYTKLGNRYRTSLCVQWEEICTNRGLYECNCSLSPITMSYGWDKWAIDYEEYFKRGRWFGRDWLITKNTIVWCCDV